MKHFRDPCCHISAGYRRPLFSNAWQGMWAGQTPANSRAIGVGLEEASGGELLPLVWRDLILGYKDRSLNHTELHRKHCISHSLSASCITSMRKISAWLVPVSHLMFAYIFVFLQRDWEGDTKAEGEKQGEGKEKERGRERGGERMQNSATNPPVA